MTKGELEILADTLGSVSRETVDRFEIYRDTDARRVGSNSETVDHKLSFIWLKTLICSVCYICLSEMSITP